MISVKAKEHFNHVKNNFSKLSLYSNYVLNSLIDCLGKTSLYRWIIENIHHLISISRMFKLILAIALVAVTVHGQSGSHEVAVAGESGGGSCNSPCGGKTKIKLEIIVPSGGCGGQAPVEDNCLGVKNSKKISRAILNVLARNEEYSFDVLTNLQIIEFTYGIIDYQTFADNIKNNDFDYVGYPRLKKFVNKYEVCKSVCKVYAVLRKALRENAATASVELNTDDNGNLNVNVVGDLIILNDATEQILGYLNSEPSVMTVNFISKIFIVDTNILGGPFAGKNINVDTVDFLVPTDVTWDISGPQGKFLLQSIYSKCSESFLY